jgi:hypothetical protein
MSIKGNDIEITVQDPHRKRVLESAILYLRALGAVDFRSRLSQGRVVAVDRIEQSKQRFDFDAEIDGKRIVGDAITIREAMDPNYEQPRMVHLAAMQHNGCAEVWIFATPDAAKRLRKTMLEYKPHPKLRIIELEST